MKGKGEKSLSVPRLLPEDELVAKIAIMALLDIQRQREIEESSFSFFSGLVEPLMKKNFPAWQLFTQLAHGTYLDALGLMLLGVGFRQAGSVRGRSFLWVG